MLRIYLTLIISSAVISCSKPKEAETEPVVPVQVSEAGQDSIQHIVTSEAVLYPKDQASIMPKISAPIRKFYVNRGDHVKQGELLAELESRDLAAAVVDAKGTYDQAQAQYKLTSSATVPDEVVKAQQDVDAAKQAMDAAQQVLQSREQLLKQGALARRLVDEARVAYAQAKSTYETAQTHLQSVQSVSRHEEVRGAEGQLTSAKGKYEAAQAQLAYAEVRSPVSGVISDRPLYAGEMASAGAPILTVMNNSRVIARASIPVGQAAYLKLGNLATIRQAEGSVETSGKVTVVSPAVDPQSTTVEVWVEAPNPVERLHPGSTVHVSILAATINDALVVPSAALVPSQEGATTVMVVGADSVAHQHKVDIGIREPDKIQIINGLKPGDKVVTVGVVGLQDGTKVRVTKPGEADKEDKGGAENKGEKDGKDEK